MKYLLKITALLALAALASCKPNDVNNNPPPAGAYSHGVWVLNEGLFGAGNASIDFYNPATKERSASVFQSVNGRPLGDVLQSMTRYNGKYYAVVNNSGKIEVMNSDDLKSVGAIEGLTSPRYMLPLSADKAYVSDFYARGISIINPSTLKVTGKITYNTGGDTTLHDWTEQMLEANNEVFVCAPINEAVLVVDPATDKITDTIHILAQPQWMVKDKNGKLWVLSSAYNRASHLYRIDPATHNVEKQFDLLNPAIGASQLAINGAGDELYFIYKDVYRINIADAQVPSSAFITASGKQFYGLGVDPENGDVYVGDAVDFTQNGSVYRYAADGTQKETIAAGFLPRDFVFVK